MPQTWTIQKIKQLPPVIQLHTSSCRSFFRLEERQWEEILTRRQQCLQMAKPCQGKLSTKKSCLTSNYYPHSSGLLFVLPDLHGDTAVENRFHGCKRDPLVEMNVCCLIFDRLWHKVCQTFVCTTAKAWQHSRQHSITLCYQTTHEILPLIFGHQCRNCTHDGVTPQGLPWLTFLTLMLVHPCPHCMAACLINTWIAHSTPESLCMHLHEICMPFL